MRENMTSFADFALAIAVPTTGSLEGQNICQLCVHISFAYGSCRLGVNSKLAQWSSS